MEDSLNTIESFTDIVTNVSQHFYNETKNNESNESVPSNYEEIDRLINICVRPVIIVLGTIGNMSTFCVMQRGSLKDVSTCFYMAILALTETGKFNEWIVFTLFSL